MSCGRTPTRHLAIAAAIGAASACFLDSTYPEATEPVLERIELAGEVRSGFARAINEAGDVAGYLDRPGGSVAFRWSGGTIVTLDELGARHSRGVGLSEDGDVSGTATFVNDGDVVSTAFVWTRDRFVDLRDLGGYRSQANAVGNGGHLVGSVLFTGDSTRAFVWRRDVATILPALEGNTAEALDVNRDGSIVGQATSAAGDLRAVQWQNGAIRDLGALAGGVSAALSINDRGFAIGYSQATIDGRCFHERGEAHDCHAVLWSPTGEITDLGTLGGTTSFATDINIHGVVVGYSTTADRQFRAFLWQDGSMIDLGALGGNRSQAFAINDAGYVVGSSAIRSYDPGVHAFVWFNGQMFDLGTRFGNSEAIDINERLEVVGHDGGPVLWRLAF